jgi:hypothetical protein
MPTVLIVDSRGTVKELAMKQYVVADLYKRAGFKSPEGFQCHCTWSLPGCSNASNVSNASNASIHLYGKTKGKANQENKYEFPPPVDNTMFFGNCLLVATAADQQDLPAIDLSKSQWETVYNRLYGGFEALGKLGGDDDAADAAEEAEALRRDRAESLELGLKMTKQGYVKDGFIVDDSADDDSTTDDDGAAQYFGVSPPAKVPNSTAVVPDTGPDTGSQRLPASKATVAKRPRVSTKSKSTALEGAEKGSEVSNIPSVVVPMTYSSLVEEDYI